MLCQNKNLRNKIVNYIYEFIDKSKFPNDLMGLYLFGFHAYFPILFYLGIFYGLIYKKYYIVKLILIIWIIILLLWYYFDGCIITSLEMKLTKSKYTQYDIFYYIFNIHHYSIEEKKELSYKINKIFICFTLLLLVYFSLYY